MSDDCDFHLKCGTPCEHDLNNQISALRAELALVKKERDRLTEALAHWHKDRAKLSPELTGFDAKTPGATYCEHAVELIRHLKESLARAEKVYREIEITISQWDEEIANGRQGIVYASRMGQLKDAMIAALRKQGGL